MATILDSVVGSCVKKLQDIIMEEAILILGVKEDLKELKRTMNQIQCFLNDAEKRRTEESSVNNWLGELKDAMYEADYIIDLAILEGNKLLVDRPLPSTNSAACTNFSFFSCLPNIQRRHKIAVRIRNFNTELNKISKLGDKFKLQNLQPEASVSEVRQMRTCQLIEPNLVGKETTLACTRLVELMLAHKERKAYKVGIVGTGGVGKTTLAQKIYNDRRIKGSFSKQAWICVSQEYSEVSLLKEILRKVGVRYEQDETVGELSEKLATSIEKKSFFLVLDDVWKHEVWTRLLRSPLDTAVTGIILLTTRNDTVARAIGVDVVHRVELMSAEIGWELLWKSMNINEETEVINLKGVGMEIVHMCGFLPLAIKVIASVLTTKDKNENQWRKFLRKSAWSMSQLPVELSGALYLSYDELPHYLKRCFLYCALYPEDWSMWRDDLIRYWIAEGFVQEQEEQLLEDTAEEYYYELIYRNLLQPKGDSLDYSYCNMHDLLRQLALHLLGEECYCGDPQSLEGKSWSRLRRISIVTEKDVVTFPDMEQKFGVRTCMTSCGEASKVENSIFERFPRVRVLDLSDSLIQSIPSSVGNLIHLRLLDLDRSDISYLPESISSLINLQILNLQSCGALHSLPLAITRLCNLRRLGLKGTPINQVPRGLGKLKFLNDLEGFPIGAGSNNSAKMQDGWNLEELDNLLQLRQLDMNRLERASTCRLDSLLVNKKYLKQLSLRCTEHTDEPCSEDDLNNIVRLFEQLIPPKNLEDLAICQFFGQRYFTWLGSATHLCSLKYLRLEDCKSCARLPSIAQLPNLKYLKIKGSVAVTKIGPEFVGYKVGNSRSTMTMTFPKLESLVIQDMPNWEEWTIVVEEQVEAMTPVKEGSPAPRMLLLPCLKLMKIKDYPKLRGLPWQLGQEATTLKELRLKDMDCLKAVENLPFLSKALVIRRCESLEQISNLPKVQELYAQGCANLRCVKRVDNLQQLWLNKDMEEVSQLWLPDLQLQNWQLHGENLGVYNWTDDDI